MPVQYCMKCMSRRAAGTAACPRCRTPYDQPGTNPNSLKPGHILKGKYLVGEVLGQGGFGITYIGLDLVLEQKVAIKEYFPVSTGTVRRHPAGTVVWNSDVSGKPGQNANIGGFLKEARKMAKVEAVPGVVNVLDFFTQNNTAYIVMEYIEGQTLAHKLRREGPMTLERCVSLLAPIMRALEQVHRHGIIHRDISPDNIMIRPNGEPVLLDLGAAKEINIPKKDGSTQSSRLVAKAGFSPVEQYTGSGKIGTWTDVYAMSATIYYCCTGKLPPAATERVERDFLTCQPFLSQREFEVLKKGMALYGKDRTQTIGGLLLQLQDVISSESGPGKKAGNDSVSRHSDPVPFSKPAAAAALFGVAAVELLYYSYVLGTIGPVLLLRAAGYLVCAYGLLKTEPASSIFSAGAVSSGLAYWFTGTIAGWAGGAAYLSAAALLLFRRTGAFQKQQLLKNGWFLPTAIFGAFFLMTCMESFSLFSFILEILSGCALTLAMYVFSKQHP